MYPTGELKRLAVHKASLRRKVALERGRCAEALARLTAPVAWVDRFLTLWKRLSPLAQGGLMSLGFLMRRSPYRWLRRIQIAMRWGPLATRAVRLAAAYVRSRSEKHAIVTGTTEGI